LGGGGWTTPPHTPTFTPLPIKLYYINHFQTNIDSFTLSPTYLLWKRINECKWQWFVSIKLYYYLYSYFLSSFYLNSLGFSWFDLFRIHCLSLTLTLSIVRRLQSLLWREQHFQYLFADSIPLPLVNGIFLPPSRYFLYGMRGEVYAVYKSE
jgi:hypothetical protein